MTRTEFLTALEQQLASLPESERADAIAYYTDYLDAAGPEHEAQTIAELGTPAEVARKILDEQEGHAPACAPETPAAKKPGHWRVWLGGGLAVLAVCLFFFQHSGAAPVQQPESTASSEAAASSVPLDSVWNRTWVTSDGESTITLDPTKILPITISADDLGENTLNIPLEKLNGELKITMNYGSVVFVTDPSLTSDKYATFQFDNFPHSPLSRTTGDGGRTTLTYEMPENWHVAADAPEAVLTVTIPADALNRLVLDLEVGDVHLSALQLQSLNTVSAEGSLYADDLTVTRDLEVNLAKGECVIEPLSGVSYANITAYRYIHLDLPDDPADYTIDARTGNVVRIVNEKYDKRYISTGSKGTINLYATGLIDLNPVHRPS